MRWSIRSNALKVGLLTVLSRFGGLIRDGLLAWLIGAGVVGDAYTTALRIPNMLRDLLGEGALSSVVVSRLGALKDNTQRCKTLVRQLVGFWGLIMLVVVALGVLFSAELVGLLAGGFDDPEKFALTVELTRTIFPYIAIVGMAAMTMGVLHHLGVFTWSSAASSFYNLSMISLLLGGSLIYGQEPEKMATWIAASVVLSGCVQWFCQLPGFNGTGYSMLPSFKFEDPELKRIVWMLIPSIVSVAAVQLNVGVNHMYASYLGDGAVSSMYFAFRLMQLPVGVVGVAVSTVLLPLLSDHLRQKDHLGFGRELAKSIVAASFLSVPAIFGLAALGSDLVALLYQRGEFTADHTQLVWLGLQGFLFGIFPYVMKKSLEQGFFAHGDTKTPLVISLCSIGVNASINGYFVFVLDLGVRGLCLGTSLVLWGNVLMLLTALSLKYKVKFPWLKLVKHLAVMLIFAAIMAGIVKGVASQLELGNLVLDTLIPGGCGAVFYLGSAVVLKKVLGWDMRKLTQEV